jgi:hypothetical protein
VVFDAGCARVSPSAVHVQIDVIFRYLQVAPPSCRVSYQRPVTIRADTCVSVH